MTKAQLLKEILKLEKSLERSYRALRTEKYIRSNEAFNAMRTLFKEVESTGQYKTIAKSKMRKTELYNYYERLQNIRGMEASKVSGWRNIRKKNKEIAKENGIDIKYVEENYEDIMDFQQSRTWQESAKMYYFSSKELNRIRWLEDADMLEEFKKMCREIENQPEYIQRFNKEGYIKYSEYVTLENMDDIISEVWRAGAGAI